MTMIQLLTILILTLVFFWLIYDMIDGYEPVVAFSIAIAYAIIIFYINTYWLAISTNSASIILYLSLIIAVFGIALFYVISFMLFIYYMYITLFVEEKISWAIIVIIIFSILFYFLWFFWPYLNSYINFFCYYDFLNIIIE
jgi:hypothetical protein